MANPLFQQLGNQANNNGVIQFIKEVQEFQKNFTGNPQQEVQKLLNSGKLTQNQFNEFAQTANQIMAMMPKN